MRSQRILYLLLALALPLVAQPAPCNIGDDGFNIGCCNPVFQTNLPAFPNMQSGGRSACILNCNVDALGQVAVVLAPPTFVTCDIALIAITITPTSVSAPGYSGLLIAKYARTWTEPSLFGASGPQVWRFIVNGDLFATPSPIAPGIGCPYPSEVGASFNTPVHFWGSIDYSCEITPVSPGPNWRFRLDLNHAPDCIQHAPWSARPLPAALGHPNRSYHIVAPASFVFAPAPEPMGAIGAESVRSSSFGAAGYLCDGEIPIGTGLLNTVFDNCLCAPAGIAGPWHHQSLNVLADCNGVTLPLSSLTLPGFVIPTGLVGLSLGSYVGAAGGGFPGTRDLTVYFGVVEYLGHCQPRIPINIVHGVATAGPLGQTYSGGFPGGPPGLFGTFIDLANNLALSGPTFGFPTWGEPAWSDLVINLNLP